MFGKNKKQEDPKQETKTDNQEKPKKIQNWFSKSFNSEKLKKSNKVAVLFLKDNRLAEPFEVEESNGTFTIKGKKYHVDQHCIYATQKDRIPLAIIREWDLVPLGTKEWYDNVGSDDDMRKNFAQLERHVIHGIKNAELYKHSESNQGLNLTPKQIILWVIVLIVGGAIAINYI